MNFKGNLTKSLTQAHYSVHQVKSECVITRDSLEHAQMLQEFLDWTKREWNINAWFRTEAYNKKVGGVSTSYHLLGTATDVSFKGFTSKMYGEKFEKYKKKWFEICDKYGVKGEFGIYDNFFHLGSHCKWKTHQPFDKRSK